MVILVLGKKGVIIVFLSKDYKMDLIKSKWKISDKDAYRGQLYIERMISHKFSNKIMVQYKLINVQDIPIYIR